MTVFDPIIERERAHTIAGVPGRYQGATVRHDEKPGCFCRQRWVSESRPIEGYGTAGRIQVHMRFDDDYRNGHNTFSITADVVTVESRKQRDIAAGGCLHEDIAKVFPELAHLIPWHLTSTDGPMHYLANATYLASDRDCWGLRKGEKRQLRNGRTKLLSWRLVAIVDGEERSARVDGVEQYADSDTEPKAPEGLRYAPWYRIGEGKARELDAARRVAVWPEASDETLCLPTEELEQHLALRLPNLLAQFRATMESIGFLWARP